METDDLEWLGTWYQQQCNGTWEHQKGMRLQALDEPAGWRLHIDLRGTADAYATPRRLQVCAMRGPWLRCLLTAQRFEGEGAEVEELIRVFRRWDRWAAAGAGSGDSRLTDEPFGCRRAVFTPG